MWLIGAERWPWAGAGQRWGRGQVAVACFAGQEGPLDGFREGHGPLTSASAGQCRLGLCSGSGGFGDGYRILFRERVFPDPRSLPSLTAGYFSEP